MTTALAAANYQREDIPHYVAPFHHKMEEAYSAADLVISRAGAASLSELSQFALPSILVPYPYATDDHQTFNAKVFTEAGAAELAAGKSHRPGQLCRARSPTCSTHDRRREADVRRRPRHSAAQLLRQRRRRSASASSPPSRTNNRMNLVSLTEFLTKGPRRVPSRSAWLVRE